MSYCDATRNCLPTEVGSLIPLLYYGVNCLTYILSMLDTIQPETILEKLETACFTFINFVVRVLVFVLSLSHLDTVWTLVFIVLALSVDALYLYYFGSLPARFSKLSTWALSLSTTTVMVENISRKERGWDSVRSVEEKTQTRVALGLESRR